MKTIRYGEYINEHRRIIYRKLNFNESWVEFVCYFRLTFSRIYGKLKHYRTKIRL